MTGILLALASGVGYGVSDFLGGLLSRRLNTVTVLLVSQATALVLLAGMVLVLGTPLPSGDVVPLAAVAGVSEVVGIAALYQGLSVGSMSIVAPVAATAPLVPLVVGLVLGEIPTYLQSGGAALALVGICLASLTPKAEGAKTGSRPVVSIALGVAAAGGFGGFYVAIDAASESSVPWTLLISRMTAVVVVVAVAAYLRPALSLHRRGLPVLVAIGALIVAADALYALASTLAVVGVVAVLSSLHPLVTMALARRFLKERLAPAQQVGVALCVVGAAAISIG